MNPFKIKIKRIKTNLNPIDMASKNGIDTIITNGKTPNNIKKIIKGEKTGTLIKGKKV